MKSVHSIAFFLISACVGVCICSCGPHQNMDAKTKFVEQHEGDSYSIFEGVILSRRGIQDSILLISGLIPERQGAKNNITTTTIRYCIHDSTVVKLERGKNTWIDTTYVNNLVKRFVGLDIQEIRADLYGTIRIQLDENPKSTIVRFENDSILKERSRECRWKHISGKWYAPEY